MRAAALTNLDIANAEGRHYLTPKARPFVVGREALGVGADGRRRWWNAVSLVEPYGSMAERTLAKAKLVFPCPKRHQMRWPPRSATPASRPGSRSAGVRGCSPAKAC